MELFRYHSGADEPIDVPRLPWPRRIYDEVWDGGRHPMGLRLPPEITGGAVIYATTIMLYRKHLPASHLGSMVVPLVVERRPHGVAIVPPSELWPRGLIEEHQRAE